MESKHGFKLLREADGKIFYSADVYFKENEPMIELNPEEKIEYDAFYESLENANTGIVRANNDDIESDDDSQVDDFESVQSNNDSNIERAINNGHIVIDRGSKDVDMSIDNLVNLARTGNLSIADVIFIHGLVQLCK